MINKSNKQKINRNKKQTNPDDRTQIKIKEQMKSVNIGVHDGVFVFTDPLTLGELAQKIQKTPAELIKYFFMKGKMLTINDLLTIEQIGEICIENNLDFKIEKEINAENILDNLEFKDDAKNLETRPPIVTIMGHVDHGKTTLLDNIRLTSVAAKEAGGITQHIGAYQVLKDNHLITFIDTPGHEAFSAMRARGADLTDIVILVVAADDGVKPQTEEAIFHVKNAKVPVIVFVNKMDKPEADYEKIMRQLSDYNILSEEWGGQTIFVKGSAISNQGINELLDAINLTAEVMEIKANPNRLAYGTVLETHLDKGYGPVPTVLIQNGTLKKSDYFVVGGTSGRVRLLLDDKKKEVLFAGPSKPVMVIGLENVPESGDKFLGLENEKEVRDIANQIRMKKNRQEQFNQLNKSLREKIASGELKNINLIIRSDVHGSYEAIKSMISKMEVEGATASILKASIGEITESDVRLAHTSNAMIIGFNVRPPRSITEIAEGLNVPIRFFNIIYKLKEELTAILKGLLDPIYEEKIIGEFTVLQIWKHSEIGTIAGGKVTYGKVMRKSKCRVIRDGIVLYTSEVSSLRHKKDEIKECSEGKECGLVVKNFSDLKEGDIVELFEEIVKEIV